MKRSWKMFQMLISKTLIFSVALMFILVSILPVGANHHFDYRELFDSHNSVMVVIRVDSGQIIYANQAAHDFYGYSPLIGMRMYQINTLTQQQIEIEMTRAVREERNYFIFNHRLADGTVKSVEVRSYPFVQDGVQYLYSIVNDRSKFAAVEHMNRMFLGMIFFGLFVVMLILGFLLDKSKKYSSEIAKKNDRIEQMIEATKAGSVQFDVIKQTMVVDERFLEIYGQTDVEAGSEVSMEQLISWMVMEDRAFLPKAIEKAQKEQLEYIELEFRVNHPLNGIIWVGAYGKIVEWLDGQIAKIAGTHIDISQRRLAEDERMAIQKRYQTILSVSDIGVWEYDVDKQNYWVNDEFLIMLGTSRKEVFDRYESLSDFWQSRVYEEDLDEALSSFDVYLAAKSNDIYESQYRILHSDGKYRWLLSRGKVIQTVGGRIFMGVYLDITEIKAKEVELNYLIQHDFLTGLYNRRFIQNQISEWIESGVLPLGIALIDLNGLRLINDTFGLSRGDDILNRFARFLSSEFTQEVVGRFGGDEFMVVRPYSSLQDLEMMKEKVATVVRRMNLEEFKLSASVGVSLLDSRLTFSEALYQAESDLNRRKALEERSALNQSIKVILNTLTQKYQREKEHSTNVAWLCRLMGEEMNLAKDDIKELELSGMVHDIGKIAIEDQVLSKPGRLTLQEYEIIQLHCQYGYQLLKAADQYSNIAINALCHHEHFDGKGYPHGLSGEEIPLFSRIIGVVDAFEAMTSDRIYRKGIKVSEAVDEIVRCSGTQFDPRVVDVFVNQVLPRYMKG